jgi:hypothetical protein
MVPSRVLWNIRRRLMCASRMDCVPAPCYLLLAFILASKAWRSDGDTRSSASVSRIRQD